MNIHKLILIAAILITALSGCATPYTNKDLRDIFTARGLETKEREEGLVVFLPGVFFESDKAELTPAAQTKLSEIAAVLNDPLVVTRNLVLEGHTDSSGEEQYNLDLSVRRAEAVYNGLVAGKVDTKRMVTKGYGEKYPIAENAKPDGSPNPEGQAKNRRVEVLIKNLEAKS